MNASLAFPIAVLLLSFVAALSDWRTGKIPNWLTLPPLAIAPAVYALAQGLEPAGTSALGALACATAPYLLFVRGAMGGGDVKLFTAIGAIAGVKLGIEIELISFIVASIYALGRLAWQGKMALTLLNSLWLVANLVLPKCSRREIQPELMATIRMGVAVLTAAVTVIYLECPILWM